MFDIDINEFDYNLPSEKIAEYPVEQRDKSKLLVAFANESKIENRLFDCIDQYIPDNSLLVVNSTKVIAARLNMYKPTGGAAELLCISPISPSVDPQIVMSEKNECVWECILGGRNIKQGMILEAGHGELKLFAEIIEKTDNIVKAKIKWNNNNLSFAELISMLGKVPLPPYIKREAAQEDIERYQTVFADKSGSVAAPTAGLHFTQNVLDRLKQKGISRAEMVLHVGPGTFLPIENDVKSHKMHSEQIFVSKNEIEKIYNELSKSNPFITATGTTSLRTLESLYWVGLKINRGEFVANNQDDLLLDQHEPYQYTDNNIINTKASFESILEYLTANNLEQIAGRTRLFVMPGYKIKTANALITNFHLPKSTLLLLVSAFIGRNFWKQIYDYALNSDYRFLSYGDSSLLIR